MQLLADDVVIIAAGQLIRQGPVDEVLGVDGARRAQVRVRTPQADELTAALAARAGAAVTPTADGAAAGHRRGRRRRSGTRRSPRRRRAARADRRARPTWNRCSCSSRPERRASDESLVRAELLKIRTTNDVVDASA